MGNADSALLPLLFRGDICNRFWCLIPLLLKGFFFSGGTGDHLLVLLLVSPVPRRAGNPAVMRINREEQAMLG
jgi:hypothetical protein